MLYGLFNTARYKYSECPQLKLKYLKIKYPNEDELELLEKLFRNDFNVTKIIKELDERITSPKEPGSPESKMKFSKLSEIAPVKEALEQLSRPKQKLGELKLKLNLSDQEEGICTQDSYVFTFLFYFSEETDNQKVP